MTDEIKNEALLGSAAVKSESKQQPATYCDEWFSKEG